MFGNIIRRTLSLLSVLALAGSAHAQDLAPLIKRGDPVGAPAWLKEGVRLSYYSAVASVPTSMYYWSPNEDGDWVSDDGKRWDRFDQPGAAGHGYTQVDVVAVEPRRVALSLRAWSFHIINGPLVPGKRSSLISLPAGGDWWVHPETLQRIPGVLRTEPGTLAQFKIVRMNMKMIPTKKVIPVIRFQYEREGARHTVAYDTETGRLVFKASMVSAPAQRWTRGNTLLSEIWFVDQRTVKLPWTGGKLPEIIRPGAIMRYEGTAKVEPTGATPLTLPLQAELKFTARGDRWAEYDQATRLGTLPGMPSPLPDHARLITAVHQLGGIWIAPAALTELKVGQVIDRDPITSEEIIVRDRRGGSVIFEAKSRAASTEAAYDARTGFLIHGRTTQMPSLVRESTELRLTRGPE